MRPRLVGPNLNASPIHCKAIFLAPQEFMTPAGVAIV